MQLLLILIVACCSSLCVQNVIGDVSCTAGTFVAGSQGVVRCDFGKDVTKDQHDFNVVWYADTTYTERKNLLACSWYNGQMTCPLKATGYLYDNRVDSTLTLVIPVVDKSMTGLYRCQLVNRPTNDTNMHFCNMAVIEMTRNVDTTDNTLMADSRSLTDGCGQVNVALIICLVIIILLFLAAVGYIIYLRKSFRFVRKAYFCMCLPCCEMEEFQHDEVALRSPSQNVDELPQTPTAATGSHNQHSTAGVLSRSQPGILTNPTSTDVKDDKDAAEEKLEENGASDSQSEKNGAAQPAGKSNTTIDDDTPSSKDEYQDNDSGSKWLSLLDHGNTN